MAIAENEISKTGTDMESHYLGSRSMITYHPWSDAILAECLAAHDAGLMPTLDLELTAKCTQAACIYCDSAPALNSDLGNELSETGTRELVEQCGDLGLRWIYTCGLGEPLEDARFRTLVETASSLNVRVSLFTNGSLINRDVADWLYAHRVCLIVKMDSLDEKTFDRILGVTGTASRIYEAVELLLAAGYASRHDEGYTDLAVSIVPTSLNVGDISAVVEYAKARNIFPSVGELERAGRMCENGAYRTLSVDSDATERLRSAVEGLLWKGYTRPICPAIITGLHVDNFGRCVVDKDTGLNCKWFLLKEPSVEVLGDVRTSNPAQLLSMVRAYRARCFRENKDGIASCESVDYVFGGCGGNPNKIIPLARQHLYRPSSGHRSTAHPGVQSGLPATF